MNDDDLQGLADAAHDEWVTQEAIEEARAEERARADRRYYEGYENGENSILADLHFAFDEHTDIEEPDAFNVVDLAKAVAKRVADLEHERDQLRARVAELERERERVREVLLGFGPPRSTAVVVESGARYGKTARTVAEMIARELGIDLTETPGPRPTTSR